ncbi:MAG: hypothetical protein CYG59_09450 [Chloroflexi bacterium]|nr:MAG: hypothetical protein CYG59_09450 [Chloroflexota bacterium]
MPASTIVVVDDNAVLLQVMQHLFARQGYQVVTSRYGNDTLDLVQNNTPALLVIDLELGPWSGLSIIEKLRAIPAFAALPVIAYSGNPIMLDPATPELKKLGCAVLEKPFSLETMLQRVGAALHGPA